MVITVSAGERILLQRLLEEELQSVRVRIHHTHDAELRTSLKDQERTVRRLLGRVEAAREVLETRVIV
jgi:hypothetical protein